MDKESFVNRRFVVESNAITAAYREGRLDAAIGHSYDLLDRIAKVDKLGFLRTLIRVQLASVLIDLRRLDEASAVLDGIVDHVEAESTRALILTRRCSILLGQAKYAEAKAAGLEVLTLDNPACWPYCKIYVAVAGHYLGEGLAARVRIDEVLADALDRGDVGIVRDVARTYAGLAVLDGDQSTQQWWDQVFSMADEYTNGGRPPAAGPCQEATGTEPPLWREAVDFLVSLPCRPNWNKLSYFDLDLYRFSSASLFSGPLHTQIAIFEEAGPPEHLANFLIGCLTSMKDEDRFVEFLTATHTFAKLRAAGITPAIPSRIRDSRFEIVKGNDPPHLIYLNWNSSSPWPWALAPVIAAVSMAYAGQCAALKKWYDAGVDLLFHHSQGEFATPWLDYAAQFAATRMGLMSVPPMVGWLLTWERLVNPRANRTEIIGMGFPRDFAESLAGSHIVGTSLHTLEGLGQMVEVYTPKQAAEHEIWGATAEVRSQLSDDPSMLEAHDRHVAEHCGFRGFFTDCAYNTTFPAVLTDDMPAYGSRSALGLAPDDPSYIGWDVADYALVKSRRVPVLDVRSLAEAQELVLAISNQDEAHQTLYFRGQTHAFDLERSPHARTWLLGDLPHSEISLPSAAHRRRFDYNDYHSLLQVAVQDEIYCRLDAEGTMWESWHHWWLSSWQNTPDQWYLSVAAFAQHYGAPTHGLDVTTSLDVAAWFAGHQLSQDEGGRYSYAPLPHAPDAEPRRRSIVYVIAPDEHVGRQPFHRLDDHNFHRITALRPLRQHAAFFAGAIPIHFNRLAEGVVAILRFDQPPAVPHLSYEYLFPGASEDAGYALAMDIKRKYQSSALQPLSDFFQEFVLRTPPG